MDIVKGSIVRSKAGKDKGVYFVVLEIEGGYALIADGRRRRVEKPKRKKLIHLAATSSVYEGSAQTNPQIRKVLFSFNYGGEKACQSKM